MKRSTQKMNFRLHQTLLMFAILLFTGPHSLANCKDVLENTPQLGCLPAYIEDICKIEDELYSLRRKLPSNTSLFPTVVSPNAYQEVYRQSLQYGSSEARLLSGLTLVMGALGEINQAQLINREKKLSLKFQDRKNIYYALIEAHKIDSGEWKNGLLLRDFILPKMKNRVASAHKKPRLNSSILAHSIMTLENEKTFCSPKLLNSDQIIRKLVSKLK